jgi:alginate O-acetyltransferase complex protein AlgI
MTAARRAAGWTVLLAGTAGVDRLGASSPPLARMLALIAFALLAMKAIVVNEERARGMPPLPLGRALAFSLAWLGMRPRVFASRAKAPLPGAADLLRRGARSLLLGGALVLAARVARHERLLATPILLVGLSLVLHFGICTVLAGLWRNRGFDCDALFRAPLRSESLGEFWSRRWNVGFSEMTTIAVFRPLAGRVGRGPAVLAGFAFSGLLHEMAISLPVRAGFGLPLLYFLIQGALVLLERRSARFERAWTLACVALPLPLLFHRPFLEGVIEPLVGIGS